MYVERQSVPARMGTPCTKLQRNDLRTILQTLGYAANSGVSSYKARNDETRAPNMLMHSAAHQLLTKDSF